MNAAAGCPSHCVMRIARSISARRAVRKLVNRLGVQASSWASSAQVRWRSRRCSFSAECNWFKFHRSRLSVPAFGNRMSPTSTTGPVRKSSGARCSQRNMNSAYWQEVAPRCCSRETAPPQSGWSVRCALRSDDCRHNSSASSYQPNPRSRRCASSAPKSAPQSKTGRAPMRASIARTRQCRVSLPMSVFEAETPATDRLQRSGQPRRAARTGVLPEPLLPPLSDVVGDFAPGTRYALAASAASMAGSWPDR